MRQTQLFDTLAQVVGGTSDAGGAFSGRHDGAPEAAKEILPLAVANVRVLVAEDNQVNQKLIMRLLEKRGYRVDVAANGIEAVGALRRAAYDVVLMDCQMPELDGWKATQQIRRLEFEGHLGQFPIPIVALTAGAMQGDREKCLSCGMDDYLTKPLRPEEVFETVERWAKWKRDKQNAPLLPPPAPHPLPKSLDIAPVNRSASPPDTAPVDTDVLDGLRD